MKHTLKSIISIGLGAMLTLSAFSTSAICAASEKSSGGELPAMADTKDGNSFTTNFTDTANGWGIDTKEDSFSGGSMNLRTSSTSTRNVHRSVTWKSSYAVEFRIKLNSFGKEIGFKLEASPYRLLTYFRDGGNGNATLFVRGDNGSGDYIIEDAKSWHVVRFEVSGASVTTYIDGKKAGTSSLTSSATTSNHRSTFFFGADKTVQPDFQIDYFKYEIDESPIIIATPDDMSQINAGSNIYVSASVLSSIKNEVDYIDFYANGTWIGRGTAPRFSYFWERPQAGEYEITAVGSNGVKSASVMASVGGTAATSVHSPSVEVADIALGEKLTLNIGNADGASISWYVNGESAGSGNGVTYTPESVGLFSIIADVTYEDGTSMTVRGHAEVTSTVTENVALQSSYSLKYNVTTGSVSASDGVYALSLTHSADSVTYKTAEGNKTYKLGAGEYTLHVDGGVCDAYYNGQFAFSFILPLGGTNGVTASGVSDLVIGGYNAIHLAASGDTSVDTVSFLGEYAAEFVTEPTDFELTLKDGYYLLSLVAKNGSMVAVTQPNGAGKPTEEALLLEMPAGKQAYRIAVSNGIAQIFINNVWTASFRMPSSVAIPKLNVSGLDSVIFKETEDLYIFEDSFDGSGELDSLTYWSADSLDTEIKDGAMVITPDTEDVDDPRNVVDDFDAADGWTAGDSIEYDGNAHLKVVGGTTETFSKTVMGAKNYTFEFRAKMITRGGESGIKLEQGTHRILFMFVPDQFLISGGEMHNVTTSEWHTYKIVVTDSKNATIYVDGTEVAKQELQARGTAVPNMAIFGKAANGTPSEMYVDYIKYTVNDVQTGTVSTEADPVTATLKAYAYTPTVKATVEASSATGGVYLTARYQNEYTNLMAGYSFKSRSYEIFTTVNGTKKVLTSKSGSFSGKVELELAVGTDSAELFVNGVSVVKASGLALDTYGMVGIATSVAGTKVHDFAYSGTGRPAPGTHSFVNTPGSPDVLEMKDGTILVISDASNIYESEDGGVTFNKTSKAGFSNNMLYLKDGTLMSIRRETVGGGYVDYAYLSKDEGKTWSKGYPVQDYVRNRITMNNKLTLGSDGRIFFASGESGDGVEGEGGVRVFWSDDGMTWHGSNVKGLDGKVITGGEEARMDAEITGVNCQEAKVVETPDGTLRLYVRTDEGFLYYSESFDNGETWTAEMKASEFISVLSAFNIERDSYTGYYYAVWEYNNINDNSTLQLPRTRVALAVSYDGLKSWEFVADYDEASTQSTANCHMNLSLKPTKDAVIVTAYRYNSPDNGKTSPASYVVSFDKAQIKTTERFSKVHSLKFGNASPALESAFNSQMIISADYGTVYSAGKAYTVEAPEKGMVPVSAMAAMVNGKLTASGNTATITFGALSVTFTEGSAVALVNDTSKAISVAPKASSSGLLVPVDVARDLFGKNVYTSESGAVVVYYDISGTLDPEELADIISEDIGEYLYDFTDVTTKDGSYDAFKFCYDNKLFAGDSGTTMSPKKTLNRAMFVTVVSRYEGIDRTKYSGASFVDVDPVLGEWYAPSVEWANGVGVAKGYGGNRFEPLQVVTVQELFTFLYRYYKDVNRPTAAVSSGKTLADFTDSATVADWAKDAMAWAVESGMYRGNGTRLDPTAPAKRELMAITMYRYARAYGN